MIKVRLLGKQPKQAWLAMPGRLRLYSSSIINREKEKFIIYIILLKRSDLIYYMVAKASEVWILMHQS